MHRFPYYYATLLSLSLSVCVCIIEYTLDNNYYYYNNWWKKRKKERKKNVYKKNKLKKSQSWLMRPLERECWCVLSSIKRPKQFIKFTKAKHNSPLYTHTQTTERDRLTHSRNVTLRNWIRRMSPWIYTEHSSKLDLIWIINHHHHSTLLCMDI